MTDKIVQLYDRDGNKIYPKIRFFPKEVFDFDRLKSANSTRYKTSGATYDSNTKTISVNSGSSSDWYTPTFHDKNIGYRENSDFMYYGSEVTPNTKYTFSCNYSLNKTDVHFYMYAFWGDSNGKLIRLQSFGGKTASLTGTISNTYTSPSNAKYVCTRFSLYTSQVTGTVSNISIKESKENIISLKNKDEDNVYPVGDMVDGTQIKDKNNNFIFPLGTGQNKYTITYRLTNSYSWVSSAKPKTYFTSNEAPFTVSNDIIYSGSYPATSSATFLGWARTADGTPQNPYVINPAQENKDITLYAIFDKYWFDVNWVNVTTGEVKYSGCPYSFYVNVDGTSQGPYRDAGAWCNRNSKVSLTNFTQVDSNYVMLTGTEQTFTSFDIIHSYGNIMLKFRSA